MLAYRNPSNEDSDNIFRYTLKLNAYAIAKNVSSVEYNASVLFIITKTKSAIIPDILKAFLTTLYPGISVININALKMPCPTILAKAMTAPKHEQTIKE